MTPRLVTTCLVVLAGQVTQAEQAKPAKEPSELGRLLATSILERRTAHDQMLAYLLARVPPMELPPDAATWSVRAAVLRKRMLNEVVLKNHPGGILEAKPGIQWLETIETGKGYRIRKLRYEGYPGMWIPALLYEPTRLEGKVPVVLNPNGHARPEGKALVDKQLRCINQAKRGMIALNPEWIAMGELRKPGYDHYELAYLDLCGQTGVGVFYMLLKRGLDVLLAHPNADPDRTAVTGLSGGGWQTIFFSSLDTRVKLAVPNAGYIGQATRFHYRQDIGDLEQCPVDQLLVADYTHLTAMLMPRPSLLIYNANDDCCFKADRARASVYDPLVPFARLYGKEARFAFHVNTDPGDHNYGLDNREAFYRFINLAFVRPDKRIDKEIPSKDEVLPQERLDVGVPEGNATFYSLAEGLMKDLPRHRAEELADTESADAWRAERRRALREVLRLQPARAELVDAKPITSTEYRARRLRYRVANHWDVPGIEIVGQGVAPRGLAIMTADSRRSACEPMAKSLLEAGRRVIAVDLLLTGACRPVDVLWWQVGMCIGNVGGRPLGIKVQQLLAIVERIRRDNPGEPITLVGVGRVSAMTVALTAALAEPGSIKKVVTVELPASLKRLITERVAYTGVPSLFCFGLLVEADVCEVLALALPAELQLVRTQGKPEEIERYLGPLARVPGAPSGGLSAMIASP